MKSELRVSRKIYEDYHNNVECDATDYCQTISMLGYDIVPDDSYDPTEMKACGKLMRLILEN